jgi:hypothetical protein
VRLDAPAGKIVPARIVERSAQQKPKTPTWCWRSGPSTAIAITGSLLVLDEWMESGQKAAFYLCGIAEDTIMFNSAATFRLSSCASVRCALRRLRNNLKNGIYCRRG